jgi:L-lysine 2,3-aminomutase
VTGFVPTQKKTEEDTQLVEENPEQTGENYIKAQQNLPDVIVVGGDPGSAPPAQANGAQP